MNFVESEFIGFLGVVLAVPGHDPFIYFQF